ncbi:MAG: alpha/beta hydrolase [Planctomycetota bacterium]
MKSPDQSTVVLFPGMGADARMFDGLREEFPRLVVPDWPDVDDRPSLRAFAGRVAERLSAAGLASPEMVLGGASFGGMVALEVAKIVKPRAVVLIGSCRHPSAIPRRLAWLEWLCRPIPTSLLDHLKFLGRAGDHGLGPMDDSHRRLLAEMMRDVPMRFVAWSSRAIFEWPGCPDPGVSVLHVHGRLDGMILSSRVVPDVWIDGAGHVPSMTHPADVGAIIRRACRLDP